MYILSLRRRNTHHGCYSRYGPVHFSDEQLSRPSGWSFVLATTVTLALRPVISNRTSALHIQTVFTPSISVFVAAPRQVPLTPGSSFCVPVFSLAQSKHLALPSPSTSSIHSISSRCKPRLQHTIIISPLNINLTTLVFSTKRYVCL
jgi:hypothetical protein